MDILMIHQGFPGQFKHLLKAVLHLRTTVTALTPRTEPKRLPRGLRWHTYRWTRGNGQNVHPLAQDLETKMIRAEALAQKAQELRASGYRPDLIVGHPGWGEMLLISEIWPSVPQLQYLEFFFGVRGTDTDIADQYAPEQTLEHRSILQARNAALLMGMNVMSRGLTPTEFQRSVLPPWAMLKTEVIHEGVDCRWLVPDEQAYIQVGNTTLRAGDPVITFVNRTFEPYRGVHVFLRALAAAQRKRKDLQAVLVGEDTPAVSYGKQRSDGKGWLSALKLELGSELDWSRIHVLGRVPHETLRRIYQTSAAHVYLSYPFVLSWSVLEAMSCGCLVIGSDTAPVREVIEHNKSGWLTPFTDEQQLAERMMEAIEPGNSAGVLRIRREARTLITEHYDLKQCVEKQLTLINSMI